MTVLDRRAFLGSCFALSGAPAFLRRGTPACRQDPRLLSRPGTPTRTPTRGATRIGEDLPRGATLYVPESYDPGRPAPLLVALHGGSGNAVRWSFLHEICEARGVILLVPESRGRTWDRALSDFGPDVAFIDTVLGYTFERCAVDPAHIALAGFSDGASYALSLGPSNGELFTHLIAWSPGFSDPADPVVGSPRVFLSHGTRDRVLPVAGSRLALVPMFEMDGYEIEYVEFDGDHEMPPEVVRRALDWFLA